MKTLSILFASAVALSSLLSPAARAADDKPAETKAVQAAPAKAMKPHSHMEERTGMPHKAPEQAGTKKKAAKDKAEHLHPRDAK